MQGVLGGWQRESENTIPMELNKAVATERERRHIGKIILKR